MDVDKEFREVDRKLKRSLDRSCIIATASVLGLTPKEYASQLDAAALAAMPNVMQEIGASYRSLKDSIIKMAEDFAIGWNAVKK